MKLWYLSSCLPLRARPGRPLPPVLADRRRGDRLRRPGRRRRVDPAAARAARASSACAGVRLRLASLGTPESRAEYRELLQAHLRAHEDELSRRRARADRPQPAARLRQRPRGHARGDGRRAPRLMDHLDAEDAEHFAAVRELLDAADSRLRDRRRRSCAGSTTTRARSSSSRATRSAPRAASAAAGATTGSRRSSAAAPTPGMGWAAGVERILLAAEERARARAGRRPLRRDRRGRPRARRSGSRPTARRAGRARAARARRPLAQGPAQAGRRGSARATLRSWARTGSS